MSDPNRHHYIPQFYLRRWGNDDREVSAFSKVRGKLYVNEYSPRSIGAEDGLYALTGVPSDKRNIVERDFMAPVVDTPAADALAVLLGEVAGPLTLELRGAWVRFLISLMVRTPARVSALKADGSAILRQQIEAKPEEYEEARGPQGPATFMEFMEARNLAHLIENFGISMLPQLVEIPEMNADIARMDWRVQHYRGGPYGFVTSDFPLCMIPGLAFPKCLISLPLSPTAVFLAAYDSPMLDAIISQPPERVIDGVNSLAIQSAQKYVYADSREYAALIEAMLVES